VAINDNGRSYDDVASIGQMVKAILQDLPKPIKVETTTGAVEVEKLVAIEKTLSKLDDNVKEGFDRLADLVEECVAAMDGLEKKRREAARSNRQSDKSLKVMANSGGGSGTGKPAQQRQQRQLTAAIAAAINPQTEKLVSILKASHKIHMKAVKTMTSAISGGSGGGGGGVPAASMPSAPLNSGKLTWGKVTTTALGLVGKQVIDIADRTRNQLGLTMGTVFRGVLTDSLQWQKDMRAGLYSTMGPGVAGTPLENKYLHVEDTVASTGMSDALVKGQLRKEFMKGNVLDQKGGQWSPRDFDRVKSTVKTTLKTATVLNASADATTDLFSDWTRQLGLSNIQMAMMGNNLEDIAKRTGIWGDNLINVSKAAGKTMKDLRDFAGIDSKAMSQIIEQHANFERFGAQELGGELQAALSGGQTSIDKATPAMRNMIYRAAGESKTIASVRNGEVLKSPDENNRFNEAFLKNVSRQLRAVSGQRLSGDLTKLTEELDELKKTNPMLAGNVRMFAQKNFHGATQVEGLAKTHAEMSKPFDVRVKELEDKKAGAKEKYVKDAYQSQIDQLKTGRNRQDLMEFSDRMSKNGGNRQKALEDINFKRDPSRRLTDAQIDQLSVNNVKDLAVRGNKAGVGVDSILKSKGLTQKSLSEGLLGKDADKFSQVVQEIEDKINLKQRANENPLVDVEQKLLEANESLKNAIEALTQKLGFKGLMGLMVAGMVGSGLMTLATLAGGFALARGGLGGLKGLMGLGRAAGGARAVAGGASTAAAAGKGFAGVSGTLGEAAQATKVAGGVTETGMAAAKGGSFLARMGGWMSTIAKKLPVIAPIVGGVSALLNTDSDRGWMERLSLGVLTGSDETGSWLGEKLGLEGKGGANQTLGLLGSVLHGGMVGGAAGAAFGGIGAVPGAIAGAGIAGVTELYKMVTDKEGALRKGLDYIGGGISSAASGAWGGIKSGWNWLWGNNQPEPTQQAAEASMPMGQPINYMPPEEIAANFKASKATDATAQAAAAAATGGSTSFEATSAKIEGLVTDVYSGIQDANTILDDINDSAKKIAENQGLSNAINAGLFDSENIKELFRDATNQGLANVVNAGLFDNGNIKDVQDLDKTMGRDINRSFSSDGDRRGETSTTKALYTTDDEGYKSSTSSGLAADLLRGDPRSKSKGEISTLLYNDEDAERFVGSAVEGARPTGASSILPSMDSIFDVLNNVHTQKFDDMIEVLEQIRDRTGAPMVIVEPGSGGGTPSKERPGMKNHLKARVKGSWPIQQPASQETLNATGDLP
jgi:hypothetical protein